MLTELDRRPWASASFVGAPPRFTFVGGTSCEGPRTGWGAAGWGSGSLVLGYGANVFVFSFGGGADGADA